MASSETYSLLIKGVKLVARKADLYVDLTLLCKAAGRQLNHYLSNSRTSLFLEALNRDTGITVAELIETNIGTGDQHTWGHRRVAYHLAMWCSAEFSVQVTAWLDQLFAFGKVDLAQPSEVDITTHLKARIKEVEDSMEALKLTSVPLIAYNAAIAELESYKLNSLSLVKKISLQLHAVSKTSVPHNEDPKKREVVAVVERYAAHGGLRHTIMRRQIKYIKRGMRDIRRQHPEAKEIFRLYDTPNSVNLVNRLKESFDSRIRFENNSFELLDGLDVSEVIKDLKLCHAARLHITT